MAIVSVVLVAFVALQHAGFLVLEMFLWSGPVGQKFFGMSAERARVTSVLAGNQGLYNGFLSAGLLWGLLHSQPDFAWQIKIFFLSCVAVAGLYGAATVNKRIFFVQSVPAFAALTALFMDGRG